MSEGTWHKVARFEEIDPEQPKQVKVGEELICVYNVDGEVYATHDICTHAFACMSDGWVEGDEVECPLHQGRFSIRTGKALGPPVSIDLKTYPAKVENGDVFIQV